MFRYVSVTDLTNAHAAEWTRIPTATHTNIEWKTFPQEWSLLEEQSISTVFKQAQTYDHV